MDHNVNVLRELSRDHMRELWVGVTEVENDREFFAQNKSPVGFVDIVTHQLLYMIHPMSLIRADVEEFLPLVLTFKVRIEAVVIPIL